MLDMKRSRKHANYDPILAWHVHRGIDRLLHCGDGKMTRLGEIFTLLFPLLTAIAMLIHLLKMKGFL